MPQFTDKIVWITGAGSGIGRATALMFAAEGATLALMGRRPEPLEAVAESSRKLGVTVEVAPLDVADNFAVAHARRRVTGCCFCTPTRNLRRAGRQPRPGTLETVKWPGISGCGFAPRG